MKITKAKLRQIVLEEAVKLEEGPMAGDIASAVLPGAGEYGQGSYASNLRNKEMEKRVYERTVKPYAQTYYDIGREYGISPDLIAGIMMDEDIRRYPDLWQSAQQAGDWWADIPGDSGPEHRGDDDIPAGASTQETGFVRGALAGDKRPAVGMSSTKLSSIIYDLAQNTNPKTEKPWIDLEKQLPGDVWWRPGWFAAGTAEKVSEWLKKPENAIRVVAARLAFDKERFERLADRELTDQELATGYSDHKKTPAEDDRKDGDYISSGRGRLAVTMGSEWLKPEVMPVITGITDAPEVKVADEFGNVGYEDALVWAPEPEEEDLDFPAIEAARAGIPEGVILDMIKGAIRELL